MLAVVSIIASLLVVLVAVLMLVVKYTIDGRDRCVGETACCVIDVLWRVNSELSSTVLDGIEVVLRSDMLPSLVFAESRIEPVADDSELSDDLKLTDGFELERLLETCTEVVIAIVGFWLLTKGRNFV